MREEQKILHDVIGTGQQNKETKTQKYIRLTFVTIFLVFFAVFIVMAIMKRFGS
jgi:hypothetical protein